MVDTIYLDNNATTCVAPEVLEVLLPYLKQDYFNPSSMYPQAEATANAISTARTSVANLLGGVDPTQILFTSCATESNNAAILGTLSASRGHSHLITTSVEHPSVLEVCREAEHRGCSVTYLPVDRQGQLNLADLAAALQPNTLLVSIMHANNETGVVFPIAELSRIVKEYNAKIVFHTDATQTVGKLPVDLVRELGNVDLLSLSGHKLHAPKGIGALFMRRGVPCRTFMAGGHQEQGRRGGTENVAFIAALGKACELAHEQLPTEENIRTLRDLLEDELTKRIPFLEVNGGKTSRLPNTLNLACHYIEGEGMLYQLSEYGICASSGSACTSGSLEPSHVLKAMQVPFTAMHGSIRFSLSRYTNEAEIHRIIEVFPEIVTNLRRLSPYWDQAHNCPRPDAPGLGSHD